ncbi:MAG: methyltransferase domain-containing protein [Cyanobacteria bacterium J06649_4]
MAWDPDKYDKFEKERLTPAQDIIPLLKIRSNIDIIDLGCGMGILTERIAKLFPNCTATGIDSSAEMLRKAAEKESEHIKFGSIGVSRS